MVSQPAGGRLQRVFTFHKVVIVKTAKSDCFDTVALTKQSISNRQNTKKP